MNKHIAATLLLALLLLPRTIHGQEPPRIEPTHQTSQANDTLQQTPDTLALPDAIVGTANDIIAKKKQKKRVRFLNGAAVGADLVGLVMKVAGTDWSQMEAMARLNFYDKLFPIFELGIGEGNHEGREIDNHFKVRAPYFRIGCDYNFTKKHNGNRLFLGLRYGFSAYNYDLDSPTPLADPVWKTEEPFSKHGLSGHLHWGELVFGIETRLWSIIRMGWDARIKFRFAQKASDIGDPWYVPGFGQNGGSSCWGGTYKLIFDI